MNVNGSMLNQSVKKSPQDNIAELEKKYKRKFELVSTEEGGVTFAGRQVTNSHLMKSVVDGTLFRYVVQPDGEIDDYYLPMKFGNEYFNNELKSKLDSLYGTGNYVCQVILNSGDRVDVPEGIDGYRYKNDNEKKIKIFIGVRTDRLDKKAESAKILDIYNNINNTKSKSVRVGYLKTMPQDLTHFLVYETTGLHDAFSSFYSQHMNGELIIFSDLDGEILKLDDIESLITTDLKGG
ncbi:hypothetical protein [Paenibacillus alginolyticus]|uniref:Uncharacterized protein n=1 Tax=Paenibacillus alginolyticus TaxID=59839 RepID=A0ABT4G7A7_9BACL|nr:hypothetical protein [Paenibacillus alginolyticus]MCY9692052.1 hypothetical protein [Paenibacillus alginolyticus]MEC0144242.1 hypothetical protein [Paenibacillus alginolyticus]